MAFFYDRQIISESPHSSKLDKSKNLRSGFTLTELLVVISVMVILLGVGGLSLTQANTGKGIDTGAATVESLIFQASSLAKAKNTTTRVLINDDPADDNYRRQMVVVFNSSAAGLAPVWVATSRPVMLPAGIHIKDDISITGLNGLGVVGNAITNPNATFSFSGQSGALSPVVFLEFNNIGICIHAAAANPGAIIGVTKGAVDRDNATITPVKGQLLAMVVWRNSATSTIDDVDRIEDNVTSDN